MGPGWKPPWQTPPLPGPEQHHRWPPAPRRSCHPPLQSSYRCLGSDLKADTADATAERDICQGPDMLSIAGRRLGMRSVPHAPPQTLAFKVRG